MGWGRTLLLGDFGNQMDIQDTQSLVDGLQSQLDSQHGVDRTQDTRIAALEHDNRELKLYVAALARLLVQRDVVTNADLTALVETVEQDERNQGVGETPVPRGAVDSPTTWERSPE